MKGSIYSHVVGSTDARHGADCPYADRGNYGANVIFLLINRFCPMYITFETIMVFNNSKFFIITECFINHAIFLNNT